MFLCHYTERTGVLLPRNGRLRLIAITPFNIFVHIVCASVARFDSASSVLDGQNVLPSVDRLYPDILFIRASTNSTI